MTRLLALALLGLAACGPQAQEEPSACAEHRCDAVPLAFEATDPVVEEVVADLRAATGADVVTDPFGTAVIFEPVAIDPSTGERRCGYTITTWFHGDVLFEEIHIATEQRDNCGSLWHTVAHELIHALDPRAEHTDGGLFAAKANLVRYFDRGAIGVICSAVTCAR